jgi:hypothetical protein
MNALQYKVNNYEETTYRIKEQNKIINIDINNLKQKIKEIKKIINIIIFIIKIMITLLMIMKKKILLNQIMKNIIYY